MDTAAAVTNGAPHHVAAAIMQLINSKPTSPTQDEIETVLRCGPQPACAALAMSPPHATLYREWRDQLARYMREFPDYDETTTPIAAVRAREDAMAARLDEISELAERILDVPAQTLGDVALLAQILSWAAWPGVDPEALEAQEVWEAEAVPGSCSDDIDLAVARLLRAILAAGSGQREFLPASLG
jgi:hypothetical protein